MNTTKWILKFDVASPRIPFPKIFTTSSATLLKLLQHRKALIKAELQLLLPSVLVELVLDHVQVTESDPPIPSPERTTQTSCLIL